MSGSKGEANFVWRCKNCKREHSASIKSQSPKAYTHEDKKVKIIEIDCRGLEFVEFKADVCALVSKYKIYGADLEQGAWSVQGTESGTKFADVDISDGEWYDYGMS